MNSTLSLVLVSLTGISFCCGALFEGYRLIAWYKRLAIGCIVCLTVTFSYFFLNHGMPERGETNSQSIRWESFETGRIYDVRAYIKNGEHTIAVVEHDGFLRLVSVPFAPHSAYLQVQLDRKSGKKILAELTRGTNATVIPLFGKALPRMATR